MTLLIPILPTASPPPAPIPRRRVVVGAYAISPVRGSEPGMGWNICRELAAYHDVTVVTAPGMPGAAPDCYRQEVAAYERENGPVPGLTVHFVEPPVLSRWCQREREPFRRTVYYAGYAAWQRSAYRAALDLHRRRPFDLAHQLNITGYREPGYLWKLPIPFVWGPIGGAADIPPAYFPLMGFHDRLFYRVRNWGNAAQKRMSRRCRRAADRAARVWAIGDENQRMARELWGCRAEDLLESGTVPRPEARARSREPGRPLRLVWSGLHIGRKALPLLLHALGRLKEKGASQGPSKSQPSPSAGPMPEVTVLGAGPETARWQQLAWALRVAPHVRWAGQLPLAEALAEVASADAMVFTSLQEGTPHAVLEALSLGLPVVCHNACGMGAAVTEDCGIKVSLCDPQSSIDGFASAIRRLRDEPGELARLSAGALRRSAELSWAVKGLHLARAYDEVLRGRVADPSAVRSLDLPLAASQKGAAAEQQVKRPAIPASVVCEAASGKIEHAFAATPPSRSPSHSPSPAVPQ